MNLMLPQDFTAFVPYRLKCGSLVLKISEESFMLLPCPAPDAPALAYLPMEFRSESSELMEKNETRTTSLTSPSDNNKLLIATDGRSAADKHSTQLECD